MQSTLFRNKNGRPHPINPSHKLNPAQRSLPLNTPPPEPEAPPPPQPSTVYDMASQAREMAELVTDLARSYGWHLAPKTALAITRTITKPEHRYNFGEFDDINGK